MSKIEKKVADIFDAMLARLDIPLTPDECSQEQIVKLIILQDMRHVAMRYFALVGVKDTIEMLRATCDAIELAQSIPNNFDGD